MKHEAATYEAAMLDWGFAEVLADEAWNNWYRPLGLPPEFRERVRSAGIARLTGADRALLLKAVLHVRSPLIAQNGISAATKFWKAVVPTTDTANFEIIPAFWGWYGRIPLGEFATGVRERPVAGAMNFRAQALEMLDVVQKGGTLRGSPIAVKKSASATPLLIEGYKRSLVALWSDAGSIEIFICQP